MLFTAVVMISMSAVTAQQADTSGEPLVMVETYFVNQRYLAVNHPRLRELRERIENATENGFQFDLPEVQERLDRHISDRKSLLRTRGLRHPELIVNATRLSVMSRLLAGQSDEVLRDVSKTTK